MVDFRPTDEQQHAVELFGRGDSLAISALAGTGKTSTLALMAEAYPDVLMRYVAFNKALTLDAARAMPANVDVSTLHSMAFKVTGAPFAHRLNSGRIKSWQIARSLSIDPVMVTTQFGKKVLQADYLAGLVMKAVDRFCSSDDEQPGTHHFPYIEGIDMPDMDGRRTHQNNKAIREHLLPALRLAWKDVTDPTAERCRFTHAVYLKLFALERRQVAADVLMMDEAQDLQPVAVQIARQQVNTRLVLVGDTNQAIYEWMGSIDAMTEIEAKHHAVLSTSFRFGPAIAETANLILERLDCDLRLVGAGPADSRVGPIDGVAGSILCRTNAASVQILLEHMKAGYKVHLVGGGADIAAFAAAAQELQETRSTRHPELCCFNSWAEVTQYVAQDPQGDELRLMVNLVEEFGVATILRALDGGVMESAADVIVSTAHKAKGRTFNTTALGGDFPDEIFEHPEFRLLYVACTRPRNVLDLQRSGAMHNLIQADRVRKFLQGELPAANGAAKDPEAVNTAAAPVITVPARVLTPEDRAAASLFDGVS